VDTKKKEVVGTFKNGREWHRKDEPTQIGTHGSRAGPGQADPLRGLRRGGERWVNAGTDHDIAAFGMAGACISMRRYRFLPKETRSRRRRR
jgi:hypothetical protein